MIPTLEFGALEAGTFAATEALRVGLREGGIIYLAANEVLPEGVRGTLLEQGRRFFGLTDEQKATVAMSRSAHFRGYVGLREEKTYGVPDVKESFEFAKDWEPPREDRPPPYYRMYGPNLWPRREWLPDFEDVLTDYLGRLERLGRGLSRALAATLRLPIGDGGRSGYFEGEPCHFSRLIYYAAPERFREDEVRLGAHTDHALFTVGLEDARGLEYEDPVGGWRRVEPRDGTVVMFLGEFAEYWSSGYYRACRHRVHGSTLQRERLSITTFFLPDLRSRVAPVDPVACGVPGAESVTRRDVGAADGAGATVGEREWARLTTIFPE